MNSIGLYLHIPFCDGKCPYCDFYSCEGDTAIKKKYTKKLIEEIERCAGRFSRRLKSMYIGGGTPNLLGRCNLVKLINAVRSHFEFEDDIEVTVEVNPTKGNDIDFNSLIKAGVNRISVGLQSANNKELEALGRKHSAQDVRRTVQRIRNSGIENISLDLMLGISLQTQESLLRSINFCGELGVSHVSLYMLKIEPGTPYFTMKDELYLPHDDTTADLYVFACDRLKLAGYSQYEISNFAKPNRESRHNLIYWNGGEYLGIGPSAHSFMCNRRFFYPSDLNSFINGNSRTIDEPPSQIVNGSREEYLMLKLRLTEGVTNDEYSRRFGEDIPVQWFDRVKTLSESGFIQTDGKSYFRLTTKGFLLSSSIIGQLIR